MLNYINDSIVGWCIYKNRKYTDKHSILSRFSHLWWIYKSSTGIM